jgi:O-antigen ligase
MFYFVLFVLILQSRASYFSILLLLLAEIILLLRKSGRLILKLTALLVILALVILALFRSERFTSIRESVSSVSYDKLKNKEVRLYLWENSIELIRENPVFGVGTGDVSDEFNKTFDEKLLIVTEGKYYDLHNEFLQTTVRLGLPGILLLLVVIILPLLKMRFHLVNNFYLSFAIIILVNFSFESMLSRLNGVVFFAYFYSFFSILYSENEQNIT